MADPPKTPVPFPKLVGNGNGRGTPAEGVATSSGVPDSPLPDTDTGRVSSAFTTQLADVGTMAQGDQLIDLVAHKIAERALTGFGNGGGGGGGFLGLDRGGWTRMVLAWVIAIVLAVGGFYLAVRDGLKARPTKEEVGKQVKSSVDQHETRGEHPKIEKRLEGVEKEQKTIRESQIEQIGVDKNQTKVLGEIKKDLRQLRRRR